MKKSKKPKKIRSIKHQITFTFIGLLFLSILTISMINGAFLEKYYVSKKTETLLEAREVLSQINTDSMTEDDVESEQEELSSEIIQESSRNNLTWVVVNEDNTKYLCWPENEDQLRSKLFFGYASDLDMDNGKGTILKQTDNCVVQQVHDRFVGMDYVECWGKFDNGNYFLIRSPLESIQESVQGRAKPVSRVPGKGLNLSAYTLYGNRSVPESGNHSGEYHGDDTVKASLKCSGGSNAKDSF